MVHMSLSTFPGGCRSTLLFTVIGSILPNNVRLSWICDTGLVVLKMGIAEMIDSLD
jgi:hypothetical protein